MVIGSRRIILRPCALAGTTDQIAHSSGVVGLGGGMEMVPMLPCGRTELPALAPKRTTPSRRSSTTRMRPAISGTVSFRFAYLIREFDARQGWATGFRSCA